MEVTRVKITRDYALLDGVHFKGSVFYISKIYRKQNSTRDVSDVYDFEGSFIGSINGHWFDFADKTLFVKSEKEEIQQKTERLLVLATKHCPRDHHDWAEILVIAGK